LLVAVVSDTHLPRGTRRLPDACVQRLRRSDLIVHAGDFSTAAVLAELEALGPPVAAVHGNVDDDELVRRLPPSRVVEAAGARIGLIHDAGPATGRLERMRAAFPDAAAVVFGHSHIPLHETAADGFQIFNPGSPTDRRRQPAHTMGEARVSDGAIRFELIELEVSPAPASPAAR
jgi:putative phosphoesterase